MKQPHEYGGEYEYKVINDVKYMCFITSGNMFKIDKNKIKEG